MRKLVSRPGDFVTIPRAKMSGHAPRRTTEDENGVLDSFGSVEVGCPGTEIGLDSGAERSPQMSMIRTLLGTTDCGPAIYLAGEHARETPSSQASSGSSR
jgi:hypothetical protein